MKKIVILFTFFALAGCEHPTGFEGTTHSLGELYHMWQFVLPDSSCGHAHAKNYLPPKEKSCDEIPAE